MLSNAHEEKKVDALLAFFKTRNFLQDNRLHTKGSVRDAYEVYRIFSSPEFQLSSEEFHQIFSGFCSISLSGDVLNCNPRICKAIQSLLSIGENRENIVIFLRELLNNPKSVSIPTSVSPVVHNLEFDRERKIAYSDAKQMLMPIKNNFLDTLCFVFTDWEYNDILLENNAVIELFSSVVGETSNTDGPIMIIEPTPFLVKRLYSNNPFSGSKILFVSDDSDLVSLYSKFFTSSLFRFISFEEFHETLSVSSTIPSSTLVFGTHFRNQHKKKECLAALLQSIKDIHTLFLLDSDDSIIKFNFNVRASYSYAHISVTISCPGGKAVIICTTSHREPAREVDITRFLGS